MAGLLIALFNSAVNAPGAERHVVRFIGSISTVRTGSLPAGSNAERALTLD